MSSRRRFVWRLLLGLVIATFVGLQLVPVDRSNPPVTSPLATTAGVEEVLRRACYDCHSNETEWPWYSYVAPVSWWVVDHVRAGRGDLNFSEWPTFDFEAEELALADIREQVLEGTMPLDSYTLMHRDARLSERDRQLLLDWAAP